MIIRRAVKIQLIVFLALALVGTTYTGAAYVGIGKGLFNPPFEVTARLADSGGIFKGAPVTYNGFTVGEVSELRLADDAVEVVMAVENDYEDRIPADTGALVANRSAVGEQFIDILPRSNSGPFLEEGSVIPMESTEIPFSTAQILLSLDKFVNSVDLDALRTTVDELDKAFSGAGPVLQTLIEDGNLLTRAAIDSLPQQRALLDDGVTVLQTQNDSREDILAWSRQLASFSEVLRSSDPDLRRLFSAGSASAVQVDALFQDFREVLPQFLADLDTLGQISQVRIPGIREAYVVFPAIVAAGLTVNPGDGTAHFGLVEEEEPPICEEGYDTVERPPSDTTDVQANLDAFCNVPVGSDTTIRGARNAFRPPCITSGPHDTSVQTPRPPAADSPASPQCTPGATAGAGAAIGDGDGAFRTAVYDPMTREVYTADGAVLELGTTGGQARLLGSQSWKAMLLSPLSSSS